MIWWCYPQGAPNVHCWLRPWLQYLWFITAMPQGALQRMIRYFRRITISGNFSLSLIPAMHVCSLLGCQSEADAAEYWRLHPPSPSLPPHPPGPNTNQWPPILHLHIHNMQHLLGDKTNKTNNICILGLSGWRSCPNCLFCPICLYCQSCLYICKYCMSSLVSIMGTRSWFLFDSITCGHQW